jgi:hypothetical protein
MQADQKAKRDAQRAELTLEGMEKKRKYQREYMSGWNRKNKEKRKANDDVQNAKKAKVAADEREALAATLAVPCPDCGTLATDVLTKNLKTLRIVACVSENCQIFFSKNWRSDGIKGTDYNKVGSALRCLAESIARDEEKRVKAEADREFEKAGGDPALLKAWSDKYDFGQRSRHFGKPCVACTKMHESREYDLCRECRGLQKWTKAYEMEVAGFFDENELFYSLHDRKGPYNREETNSRADFVFDDNDAPNLVIVEVDENQHRDRELKCEIARMADLRDQHPGRPIICIRYNPIRSSHTSTDQKLIAGESKMLLADCVRHALQVAPSKSVLG